MRPRKQILQKLEQFYGDVQSKRKNQNTRLQVDIKFQQVEIKDLNDKKNVTMFTTSLREGKAFAVEQKIKELKSRISKVKAISDKNKAKIPAVTIIKQSAVNMNDEKSEKYGISPNDIEKKSLFSEKFKTLFNFKRIEQSKQIPDRLDKYDRRKYAANKKNYWKIQMLVKKSLFWSKESRKNQVLANFINKQLKISLILTKKPYLQ